MFRKKKGMIDVVEMHKRGMVIAPKRDPIVDKFKMGKDGFVEMKKDAVSDSSPASAESNFSSPASTQDNAGFPNFFDFNSAPSPTLSSESSFPSSTSSLSSTKDVYEKREVDEKVEKLDNLIYKLEQRILELEKKLGVNQSSW